MPHFFLLDNYLTQHGICASIALLDPSLQATLFMESVLIDLLG